MSIAEARSEIKTRFEQATEIERRYPEGLITSADDEAQVKSLLGEVDDLETKLHALEDADLRKGRIANGLRQYNTPAELHQQPTADLDVDPSRKSLGERFTDDPEYQRLLASGQFNNSRNIVQFTVPLPKTRLFQDAVLQRKALVTTGTGSGGPMIFPDIRPGILPLYFRERTILDLVPTAQTTSDLIEYVKILAFTNAAAPVAEATATTGTTGTKPESALTTALVSAPVVTIAHWIPVTNKMLADAPAIRGLIDQHLMLGLELALEDQILSGSGVGDNMTGILASGIQNQAKGTDSGIDAIFKALTKVRVTGLVRPTAIVMNPSDFATIRLARESAATATPGSYLMGPPSMGGEVTLWGLPVIDSLALTAGTALVGAFNLGGMFFEREASVLRVGLINDQFVRNMQTILAESRGVWATFRPTAFCSVTGL